MMAVPASPPVKVVYIGGSARSGTGILGRILSKMRSTAHGGELRRLWSRGLRPGRRCDCGRPHDECEIWSALLVPEASYLEPDLATLGELQRKAAPEVHAGLHALKILYRTSRGRRSADEERYVRIYSDLLRQFAKVTGASVILDNSKNPADAALLVDAPDVTVYCAQIVRDPRGVLFSIRRRAHPENSAGTFPLEAARIAVYWALRQVTFDALRRRYGPERSFMVVYEELMRDPDPVLRTASRSLDLPVPEERVAIGVPLHMPEVHGPDGSGRFTPTEVVLREATRWERELSLLDRIIVSLITFPWLLRYGYPIWIGRSSGPSA